MLFFRSKRSWRIRVLILLALGIGLFVYSRQFHPEAEDVAGQRALLANRERVDRPWRIDALSLLGDVRTLAAPDMEGRGVGTAGGLKARNYLIGRFSAIGLEPVLANYQQPFTFTPGRGIRFWRAKFWATPQAISGVNLVGRIRGSVEPEKYLLVTAHYDHLGIRNGKLYPGADDNASGVAAMLAIASYYRTHPPRHSLLFVAFDGEESGLRGARAFIDQPPVPRADMLVDVNFDMLSRNPAGEIFLSGLYANPQLRPLIDPVRATAVPTILYGHDYPRPFWNGDDWTSQSDQGVFADKDIPFVYLGVEDHPDYHQPTDTFERIDQKFYTSVADSTIDLVAALDAAGSAQLAKAH
jgi:hypothetical protein